MDYQQFLKFIKERTANTVGKEGVVEIHRILKNNGVELDGLTIMKNGFKGSPTIYLNEYYRQYKAGRTVDAIVREIIQLYDVNMEKMQFSADSFRRFEDIKDRIVYKLVNYKSNRKLLEDVPYQRIMNLAVIYYVLVEQKEDGNATILIHNSHLAMWKVSKADVYKKAIDNTARLLPAKITPMKKMLENVSECGISLGESGNDMYVLTNNIGLNGACCMMYEDVLDNFAHRFESDVIIIPSSIHEVLLIPYYSGCDIDSLIGLVNEVNSTMVEREEILSDTVYVYHIDTGKVTEE